MKMYELFFIYLIATALGVIIRYILGYRRRHIPFVAINVLFGGIACVINSALYGADFFEIFLSGLGGAVGNCVYAILKLIVLSVN